MNRSWREIPRLSPSRLTLSSLNVSDRTRSSIWSSLPAIRCAASPTGFAVSTRTRSKSMALSSKALLPDCGRRANWVMARGQQELRSENKAQVGELFYAALRLVAEVIEDAPQRVRMRVEPRMPVRRQAGLAGFRRQRLLRSEPVAGPRIRQCQMSPDEAAPMHGRTDLSFRPSRAQ